MNILFDFVHAADVNLFKHSIYRLKNEGYNVVLTLRVRGVLMQIAEKEFPGYKINVIGYHKKGIIRKVFSIIGREIRFFRFLKKNSIDVVVCQGVTFGIACKILGVPLIHHDDDPEYRLTYLMGKYLSAVDIIPESVSVSGSRHLKYKGFKEVAYLHPNYFSPDILSVERLNLVPFQYVFIREIANVSVNYKGRTSFLLGVLKHLKSKSIVPILSLEDKSLIPTFSDLAIILKEPLDNLHSLMYFAKFVISSGDTMAREACLLGTPTVYTGGRLMVANDVFLNLKCMIKLDDVELVINEIDRLLEQSNDNEIRAHMSDFVRSNYEDLNELICKQILSFKK